MNGKNSILIWVVVPMCVVLILGVVGFALYQRGSEASYEDEIFDHSYQIDFNLYSSSHVNAMYSSDPCYYLSDDGILFKVKRDVSGYKAEALTGSMEKIQLTEGNFDNKLNEDNWVASNITITGARFNNKGTWYYQGEDGATYYLMLQNNGDVFLCIGYYGGISEIQLLDSAGDRDVFYSYIDRMNERYG